MVRNKRTFSESYGETAISSDANSGNNLIQSGDAYVVANARFNFSNTATRTSNSAINVTQPLGHVPDTQSRNHYYGSSSEMGYSTEQYVALHRNGSQMSPALLPQRFNPQHMFRPQPHAQNENSAQFSAILPQMFQSSYPVVYIPVPLPISDAVIRYVHSFQLFDQQQQYHQHQAGVSQLTASRAPPFLPQQAPITQFADPMPTPAGFSMPTRRDNLQPFSVPLVPLSIPALLEPAKPPFEKSAEVVAEPTTPQALNLVGIPAVHNSSLAQPEKRAECMDIGAQTTLSGTLPEALVFCPPLIPPPFHEEASEIPTEREQKQELPVAECSPTHVPIQDNNALDSALLSDSASSEQQLPIEEAPLDCAGITNADEGKEEEIEEEVVKAHNKKEEDMCVVVIASTCRAEESAAQNGSDGAGDKLEAMAANLDAPAADAAPILVAEQTQESIISQNEATLEDDTFDADQEQVSALKDSVATRPIPKYPKRIRKSKQDTEEIARLAACHPAAPYITTIGPKPSISISSSVGVGADAEAWRQQVRYHWHGTLLFDPERCVQVWRGSWLGTQKTTVIVQTSTGKKSGKIENQSGSVEAPTEEAFNATETIFEYLSTKVRKHNVHQSAQDDTLVPQSGYFRGFFKMRSLKAKTYLKHNDYDFYIVFEPYAPGKDGLVHEYALYGRGMGEYGAFIVHGRYSNETGLMQAVRIYLHEADDRAKMTLKQLQAWFQHGGII